jgi:hypothetical protein
VSIAASQMAEAVACLRAAGVSEFEGDVPGWGRVKLRLGPLPETPEAEKKPDAKDPPKRDPISDLERRMFGAPLT